MRLAQAGRAGEQEVLAFPVELPDIPQAAFHHLAHCRPLLPVIVGQAEVVKGTLPRRGHVAQLLIHQLVQDRLPAGAGLAVGHAPVHAGWAGVGRLQVGLSDPGCRHQGLQLLPPGADLRVDVLQGVRLKDGRCAALGIQAGQRPPGGLHLRVLFVKQGQGVGLPPLSVPAAGGQDFISPLRQFFGVFHFLHPLASPWPNAACHRSVLWLFVVCFGGSRNGREFLLLYASPPL